MRCEKCNTNLIGRDRVKSESTINGLLCIPCDDKRKRAAEKMQKASEKWLKDLKKKGDE